MGAEISGMDGLARSGARFAILSVASFAVTLGTTAWCHEILGLPEEAAYLVALIVALFQNFLGMRYYVYPGSDTPFLVQLAQFLGSSVAFRLAEFSAFLALHTWAGVPYLIAAATVMVSSFVAKFFFYRTAIFR